MEVKEYAEKIVALVEAAVTAERERCAEYFERIIQVRGGAGMLEGKEALDEMARLAGEALAHVIPKTNAERDRLAKVNAALLGALQAARVVVEAEGARATLQIIDSALAACRTKEPVP